MMRKMIINQATDWILFINQLIIQLGYVSLVVINGTIILVPYLQVESMQLIWRNHIKKHRILQWTKTWLHDRVPGL